MIIENFEILFRVKNYENIKKKVERKKKNENNYGRTNSNSFNSIALFLFYLWDIKEIFRIRRNGGRNI